MNDVIRISSEPFTGFNSSYQVASCFCVDNESFLLIKRSQDIPQGGTWSIPSQKTEKETRIKETICRELKNTTNIQIEETSLTQVASLYVRRKKDPRQSKNESDSDYEDYVYTIFETILPNIPPIKLNEEKYTEYRWVTLQSISLYHPLISGAEEALKVYKIYLQQHNRREVSEGKK